MAISSLGLGSGVLTSDVIDQLKTADEARIVKPIENKITLNNQKQDAYNLLSSLMTSFKSNASALSYDTLFDSKNVSSSGDAEVTIEDGATVESFTLETTTLAKKDITKLGALSSASSSIATGSGVLKINDYEIAYDENTTLEDLAQSITDTAGATVSASILQTGTGAYTLVLSSESTGADQALDISYTNDEPHDNRDHDKHDNRDHDKHDNNGLNAALFEPYSEPDNLSGYQKIQDATDASFKYNGITTTRSTNDISDLILGVNISLKTEGDFSSVNVSQNTTSITDQVQLFVDSYNSLMTNLKDMTIKDKETGAEGVFQGESFVKSLSREFSGIVTSMVGSDSLVNFGIDVDRYGTMSFNANTLATKISEDSDSVKAFFTGGTDSEGNDVTGIFTKINDTVNNFTGYNGLLSNFYNGLKSDGDNLADSYTKAQDSLTNRYDIMTKRFSAYDALISKINASFSSLQMMISAQVNGTSN
jgi:flagellar hook-associated protein 2